MTPRGRGIRVTLEKRPLLHLEHAGQFTIGIAKRSVRVHTPHLLGAHSYITSGYLSDMYQQIHAHQVAIVLLLRGEDGDRDPVFPFVAAGMIREHHRIVCSAESIKSSRFRISKLTVSANKDSDTPFRQLRENILRHNTMNHSLLVVTPLPNSHGYKW